MQRVLQCRRAANETSVVRELSGGHEMVFWGLMWLCTREMRKEMANNLMIYIICCNNGALARARWRYSSQNAAKICNSFGRPFPSFQLATCKWYKSIGQNARAINEHTFLFGFLKSMGKKCFARGFVAVTGSPPPSLPCPPSGSMYKCVRFNGSTVVSRCPGMGSFGHMWFFPAQHRTASTTQQPAA